ncbi:MAG: hypothetical protein Q8Q09_07075 [Deltaproteobacteria bacterium]|nr:hypothetical protein [Deltaproteobacteria bacterium]
MLAELDAIDWSKLSHAYGPATDVPDMLRALNARDEETVRDALAHAFSNIFHQGTRYTATAEAIPFVAHIAESKRGPERAQVLSLLTHCIAGHFSLVHGPDTASGAIWSSTPPTTHAQSDYEQVLASCENAGESTIAVALSSLTHPSPRVRMPAAHLLAALRGFADRHAVSERLSACIADEPNDDVRAVMLFAWGHTSGLRDHTLCATHARAPEPSLSRLVASVMCLRRGHSASEFAKIVLDAMDDVSLATAYGGLSICATELVSDLAEVLQQCAPSSLDAAFDRLLARLAVVSDFSAVGLLRAALSVAFADAPVPAEFNDRQRALLETLARNQGFWMLGNALNILAERGLPGDRERLAALVGVAVVHDPIAQLRQRARFGESFGPEHSLNDWNELLALVPDDPEALARSGAALLKLDEVDEGVARLSRGVDSLTGQDQGYALASIGYVHAEREEYALALEYFVRAQAHFTGENAEQLQHNRVAMLERLGRPDEALALNYALEPTDAEGFYRRGLAEVKAGRYRESIASITRSLESNPTHANAHYTLACAYALSGEPDHALDSIETALKLDSGLRDDIANDSDFEAIRALPRFASLVHGVLH